MNDTDETPKEERDEPANIDLAEVANVALDRIAELAITHPMRTLAIAAAVGYSLGRGVPTIAVRLGMIFGARIITNALVSASLEQLGSSMRGDTAPDDATTATADSPGKPGKRRANGRAGRRNGAATSASAHD